ncbi:MAG: glycogen/starch synthase [Chitinophagales bacterium]|nr:glycogen/starch synthase [Chitinophagales bacterium]
MEILHVSAECYPVAKVGGLADVAGALPKYLNRAGAVARLIMPYYNNKFIKKHDWETVFEGNFPLGTLSYQYRILKEKNGTLGFDLFVTEIPGLLEEELPYGYSNDLERHIGFQIAVVDWLSHAEHQYDVIHCHDHHTGLIPFMMNYCYSYDMLSKIPTVFTIHNGQYQGYFLKEQQHLIPHYDNWKQGLLEWNNTINPMAAAIKCCWKFTTVSPNYLNELRNDAFTLESLIVSEKDKSTGILNGIDADIWNPETDSWIEKTYNSAGVTKGKTKNKKALLKEFHLQSGLKKPLVIFIGRLVAEKGGDVLAESIRQSVSELKGNISFLVLGSGVKQYETDLKVLRELLPENFNCYIGYNEKLAHLMYAGADFLLMPSRMEPCGLNQLYALHYGTVPIVRSTGGLIDTVLDLEEEGFGIRFTSTSFPDISLALKRAEALFINEDKIKKIKKQIMNIDHSWEQVTGEYMDLYSSLKKDV